MLVKTRILLNIFDEEIEEEKEIVSFEETEADRLVKGMSHEEYYGDSEDSENKIVAKEFRDCIISTDNKTMIVQKKKGELIHLYLDDGMTFEEDDLDLFAYRFYNGEQVE